MRFLARRAPQGDLVHIWCSECGRDLDWAQPSFVAAVPRPRCGPCVSAAALEAEKVAARVEELRLIGQSTAQELYRIAAPVPRALSA